VSAPAATAGDTDDEARHRQLTVLAGWRRFVDEEPAPPELLPDREWRRLGDNGRLAYDEARLNHHSRLLTVATPVIRKVITEGRRLSYLNRNADSGRCGLILSGPARTGKTTAITQLGKTLEVIHRQRHPPLRKRHPRPLHHRPARCHRQDDRRRVRPVPRPARHPPGQPD
jgi:hypothetical protein